MPGRSQSTILGIDPGVADTGYGIITPHGNGYMVHDYGSIVTKPKQPAEERLAQIYKEVQTLIKKYKPETLAIEKLFFNQNITTAMAVSQARGVVLLAAAQAGLKIEEYTPLQVKTALAAYGRASKDQMQRMVKMVLGLQAIPKPDDAADALAIAICSANHLKH